ncbi:uncharacterized protein PG986_006790 [Apiospora aurea]|uniref:Uncharacterized protein n=1 Tax=Apiospora aurea TaxID=335848 RepID=A0ABR1QB25_9PEZI
MQFTVFLTSIAAFAAGTAHAAAVPRQGKDNPRLAQFRIFSDVGCSNLNQGFYTVDRDQTSTCGQLNNVPVKSLKLERLEPAADGCELRLYISNDCTEKAVTANVGVCNDATETGPSGGIPTWNSWQMVCPSSATNGTMSM